MHGKVMEFEKKTELSWKNHTAQNMLGSNRFS